MDEGVIAEANMPYLERYRVRRLPVTTRRHSGEREIVKNKSPFVHPISLPVSHGTTCSDGDGYYHERDIYITGGSGAIGFYS